MPLYKWGNLNAEIIIHTRIALCEDGGRDQMEHPQTKEVLEARARVATDPPGATVKSLTLAWTSGL